MSRKKGTQYTQPFHFNFNQRKWANHEIKQIESMKFINYLAKFNNSSFFLGNSVTKNLMNKKNYELRFSNGKKKTCKRKEWEKLPVS